MRKDGLVQLLDLARRLASTAEGMTLDEIASAMEVSRATASRLRDAMESAFPGQFVREAEGKSARFRLKGGLDGFLQAPSAEELAALDTAITALVDAGDAARAAPLRRLQEKVVAALRADLLRRIEPDLDALRRAERLVVTAGPTAPADPAMLETIRYALVAATCIDAAYAPRPAADQSAADTLPRRRLLHPCGLLYNRHAYLVAREDGRDEPVLWRLDRLSEVSPANRPVERPEDFDLAVFARRSFGVFQEPPEDVVLRFAPKAAQDARKFRFHDSQSCEDEADGSLIVRFRAGGLLELARHLFTWSDTVTILAPERLRQMLIAECEKVAAVYEEAEIG